MATEYEYAPDVETIAKDLIADVEDHFDLGNVEILYVFRDKASRSRGRAVLGRARKVTGLNRFLIRPDDDPDLPLFVLEIAKDTWSDLTDEGRRALVDHELSHLVVGENEDGELVGGIRGHDLEEFIGVVERHGLWKPDVVAMGTAAAAKVEQLTLHLVGDDAAGKGPNNKGGRP
jgi:predicted metallopeptidase